MNSLLDGSLAAAAEYVEKNAVLSSLTHGIGVRMRQTSDNLLRVGRPGFRQRPGTRADVIRGFAKQLNSYAAKIDELRPDLMDAYRRMVGDFGRALSVVAPLAPLPDLFRPAIAGTHPRVTEMQNALSQLRSSAEGTRQAIASWEKQDVDEFNIAKRHALTSLDYLDSEFTYALHLTRELERTLEEFLERDALTF